MTCVQSGFQKVDDQSWIIYGKAREPKHFFVFGERVHIKKHLEDLQKRGIVSQKNGLILMKK